MSNAIQVEPGNDGTYTITCGDQKVTIKPVSAAPGASGGITPPGDDGTVVVMLRDAADPKLLRTLLDEQLRPAKTLEIHAAEGDLELRELQAVQETAQARGLSVRVRVSGNG
jgi:hypothetical protein